MSASLVGSEMCIRDRLWHRRWQSSQSSPPPPFHREDTAPPDPKACRPVSYTHLTLPTICSV
eukprot:11837282-Alexandrium_andersonii.AAC.1